jgi:hypothetical protein
MNGVLIVIYQILPKGKFDCFSRAAHPLMIRPSPEQRKPSPLLRAGGRPFCPITVLKWACRKVAHPNWTFPVQFPTTPYSVHDHNCWVSVCWMFEPHAKIRAGAAHEHSNANDRF